ncbi:hypothetical protein [Vibrio panuliri]|uniref:HTH cro/C1-type domain-containing protein n=1 Tax=Vibrio panuliri TaxID=1381081 RepID=A0ABX3FG75_9VIBR|nr:hypothetical protein [Vibrio panuliri]KAB1457392.1 hypothetical protein F7O85_06525 [Vibrio panuliri]OLQ91446.1 hypothetical protein BIY20_01155 [Vibrio panuliri]
MITSIDILNKLSVRYNVSTYRELACLMGISHGLILRYKKGESLSISNALRFADELGLDKYHVLIGNLCEKSLIPQEAKEMLAATIGEDLRLKPDKITTLLRDSNKEETTQTDSV